MLSAVSLFSGCGGFCEGVELAGFDVRCGVELDRFAAATYRKNFPKTPLFEGDIHEFLAPKPGKHKQEFDLDSVDLVFGGPPCQGFSQIGTRDLRDARNELYKQFVRVVRLLRPRAVLMENVPNLLLLQKGHYRDLIVTEFARAGYSNIAVLLVHAADYGVPQTRRRVMFVATRDDLHFPYDITEYCTAFLESIRLPRQVTVAEAIGDLPRSVVDSGHTMPYPHRRRLSAFQRLMRLDQSTSLYSIARKRTRGIGDGPLLLHNHHTKEIQSRRLHLISLLKPGDKAHALPKRVWDGLRPEKWRRLHPDKPSHTLLAQMHRDLSEFVHPSLNRWISVREAARLQSFHDGFVFVGSEWQQLKQIGNAVPPLLGHAVAQLAHSLVTFFETGELEAEVGDAVQTALPF